MENQGVNFSEPLGDKEELSIAKEFVIKFFGPQRIVYAAVRATNNQEKYLKSCNARFLENPEMALPCMLPCFLPHFLFLAILSG